MPLHQNQREKYIQNVRLKYAWIQRESTRLVFALTTLRE